MTVKVEVWSDVVCPWCYIGKRRLEAALAAFEHADRVDVVWRAFELDPSAPAVRQGDYVGRLARKYGMTRDQAALSTARLTDLGAEVGLDFRFDRVRPGNTFDAHRLLHHAAGEGRRDALKERLLRAYFTEGEAIGDRATLERLAVEVGLDGPAAAAVLGGDAHAGAVREDERQAEAHGATGVPFFVVDASFAIPGAQDVETMLRVLERAWQRAHPLETVPGAGMCDGGACPV